MDQWVIAGIALLGVAGQWLVGSRASARRDGRLDGEIENHGARLDSHSDQIEELKREDARHGERLAELEGWKKAQD